MQFKQLIAAAIAAASFSSAQVFAAVPTEVTTALGDAKADGLTVAGLVLVIIIAIAAFKFIRRAL